MTSQISAGGALLPAVALAPSGSTRSWRQLLARSLSRTVGPGDRPVSFGMINSPGSERAR
jgi:hypothetical protein